MRLFYKTSVGRVKGAVFLEKLKQALEFDPDCVVQTQLTFEN